MLINNPPIIAFLLNHCDELLTNLHFLSHWLELSEINNFFLENWNKSWIFSAFESFVNFHIIAMAIKIRLSFCELKASKTFENNKS